MKKFIKSFLTISIIAVLLVSSTVTSFAVDELTVNGAKAKVGSTVTYVLNLGDASEEIVGLQMQVIYDDEYLKIDENSVYFPNVSGMVSNAGVSGIVLFNYASVQNPVNFAQSMQLVTMNFEVLKAGETEITYFVTELYGMKAINGDEDDFQPYLKSYTFTYDLSVDDKLVVEQGTPAVNNDDALKNEYQGDFINYADGKGEGNADTNNEEHVAVTGETTVVSSPIDIEKDDPNNITTILCIVGAVLIIGIIVILVILKNKNTSKTTNEKDLSQELKETTEDAQE